MIKKYATLLSFVAAAVAISALWYVTRWDLQWFLVYAIVSLTVIYVTARLFAGMPIFGKSAAADDIASDSNYVDLRTMDMAGIGAPAERMSEAYDKMRSGGYDADSTEFKKLAEQEYP